MKSAPDVFNLPARSRDSDLLNVIIENPKGTGSKFKYDDELGLFRLHKHLPRGTVFPFDFGFVPSTLGEDGDALDVIVLMEEGTFTGCLVTTRVLGVIVAEQTEKGVKIRNDRLVGVPETEKIRPAARLLEDLAPGVLDQIEHFFISYNRMEGRTFEPVGRRGPGEAATIIEKGMQSFLESA